MKILLILTGGTICSARNDEGLNELSTEAASLLLVNRYREQQGIFENKEELMEKRSISENSSEDIIFESIAPINTLSENMTINKWNHLIDALKAVDYSDYAGVMILHGTDTLHLTSALVGVLLEDIGCPVMMISAQRILDDPESNGVDNFAKSISFIRRLDKEQKGGVYVVYRNMDGISYVHHATHLCGDYSENFYSDDMIAYDKLMNEEPGGLDNFILAEASRISEAGKRTERLIDSVEKINDDVLYIRPYVGINYDRLSLEGVRAVLHGMYHSSTLNTEGDGAASAISLLKRCNKEGIAFYIFPCKDGDYRYSTTKPLIDGGAKCIYGMTWEEAYIRILLRL